MKCSTLAIALFLCISAGCFRVSVAQINDVVTYLREFLHNAEDQPYDIELAQHIEAVGLNMSMNYYQLIKNGKSLGFSFYNEWENIVRDLNVNEKGAQCILQLGALVAGFGNNDLTSYRYFDSWGKIPAGILKGHITELGNFDECVQLNKMIATDNYIEGKYCFANVPIGKLLGSPLLGAFPVRIGVCMPAACSAGEFDVFLKNLLKNVLNINIGPNTTLVSPNNCRTKEHIPFYTSSWWAVGVLITLGCAMLFSSLYEFTVKLCGKTPLPFLCAFSVQRNMAQLTRVVPNTKSRNVIPCLNGIRCLSIVWVIIGHSVTLSLILPHINTVDILPWGRTAFSMLIQQGAYSVDSFFFLSGLLVAFLALRDMERNNGKLNVIMMYVHRILRLTPMLALAMLVYRGLMNQMGNTPIWNQFSTYTNFCPKTWWQTIIYLQNYLGVNEMCLNHTWYLAVDMQLYIISPILLIMVYKWGKKGIAIIAAIGVGLAAWLIAAVIVNEYTFHTNGLGIGGGESGQKTYFPTHFHASPWIVGFILGYFLHKTKQQRVKMAKWVVALGWLLCFAIFMTLIFDMYPQAQVGARTLTFVEEALNLSLGRVAWPMALGWIVFASYNGYGGPVNAFLANPIWQPFARLSYCMYMWHVFMISYNHGRTKTNTYWSSYDILLIFWGDYGWTLMLSIVMYLAFEAPLVNLEQLLLPKGNSKKPAQPATQAKMPNDSEILETVKVQEKSNEALEAAEPKQLNEFDDQQQVDSDEQLTNGKGVLDADNTTAENHSEAEEPSVIVADSNDIHNSKDIDVEKL